MSTRHANKRNVDRNRLNHSTCVRIHNTMEDVHEVIAFRTGVMIVNLEYPRTQNSKA